MTPTKDSALSRNAACGPAAATMIPANAGPMARARLMPRLFRAIAAGNCARGTSSGSVAAHAGVFSAAPQASAKVKPSSIQALIQPSAVTTVSSAATVSIHNWVMMRYRRRSMMSASAPPGSASRNIGSAVAACTRDTINGSGSSVTISQPAPTSCIQVPIFDATVAIHNMRNSGCVNGDQAEGDEGGGGGGEDSVMAMRHRIPGSTQGRHDTRAAACLTAQARPHRRTRLRDRLRAGAPGGTPGPSACGRHAPRWLHWVNCSTPPHRGRAVCLGEHSRHQQDPLQWRRVSAADRACAPWPNGHRSPPAASRCAATRAVPAP